MGLLCCSGWLLLPRLLLSSHTQPPISTGWPVTLKHGWKHVMLVPNAGQLPRCLARHTARCYTPTSNAPALPLPSCCCARQSRTPAPTVAALLPLLLPLLLLLLSFGRPKLMNHKGTESERG